MLRPLLAALLMGMFSPLESGEQGVASVIRNVTLAPPAQEESFNSFSLLAEELTASGFLITDLQSGMPLFGKDADVPRPIASLTKLMTALIIAENHEMNEWVALPPDIELVQGNIAYLPSGHHFTVGDLLSATLIGSANDAAIALARYHSESVEEFVNEMNARARELGLQRTSYANPVGFDSQEQKSSPQDVLWLTSFLQRFPAIRNRMGLRGVRLVSLEGARVTLSHTHALLHADTPVIAGKTGTTEAAGECLLSIVRGKERDYAVVLLHSANRYADMRKVLEAIAAFEGESQNEPLKISSSSLPQ